MRLEKLSKDVEFRSGGFRERPVLTDCSPSEDQDPSEVQFLQTTQRVIESTLESCASDLLLEMAKEQFAAGGKETSSPIGLRARPGT